MKPLPPKPAQKFQVLLVEDDLGRADLLTTSLKELNMDCRHAPSGTLGLQAFREKMPHLVLLDVMMPGLDGYEVCRQMRADSTVPIVLLNESSSDEHVMKGLKLGADDYLNKDMNPQVMSAHVIAWLRRVYRYDQTESVAPPSPQPASRSTQAAHLNHIPQAPANGPINMPSGWVRCESCSYMGPRMKFEQQNMLDVGGLICPVCKSREHLVHLLS